MHSRPSSSCLYGLSWAILFGAVVLMCFRPNPSEATLRPSCSRLWAPSATSPPTLCCGASCGCSATAIPPVPVPQDAGADSPGDPRRSHSPTAAGRPSTAWCCEEIAPY